MHHSGRGQFFFFNATAPTEIYTLSLHDALPICSRTKQRPHLWPVDSRPQGCRSEEHTSELQSHVNLVCRLLLEKKKPQSAGGYRSPRHTLQVMHGQSAATGDRTCTDLDELKVRM